MEHVSRVVRRFVGHLGQVLLPIKPSVVALWIQPQAVMRKFMESKLSRVLQQQSRCNLHWFKPVVNVKFGLVVVVLLAVGVPIYLWSAYQNGRWSTQADADAIIVAAGQRWMSPATLVLDARAEVVDLQSRGRMSSAMAIPDDRPLQGSDLVFRQRSMQDAQVDMLAKQGDIRSIRQLRTFVCVYETWHHLLTRRERAIVRRFYSEIAEMANQHDTYRSLIATLPNSAL